MFKLTVFYLNRMNDVQDQIKNVHLLLVFVFCTFGPRTPFYQNCRLFCSDVTPNVFPAFHFSRRSLKNSDSASRRVCICAPLGAAVTVRSVSFPVRVFTLQSLFRSQIRVTRNHVSVQFIKNGRGVVFLYRKPKTDVVAPCRSRLRGRTPPRLREQRCVMITRSSRDSACLTPETDCSLPCPARSRSAGAPRSGDRGGDQRRHGHPVVDARPGQPQSHRRLQSAGAQPVLVRLANRQNR